MFFGFLGTIFPVLSEAITNEKITVGPPFYNKISIPIGLILLLLTGVGPLLVWGKTSKKVLYRNFKSSFFHFTSIFYFVLVY